MVEENRTNENTENANSGQNNVALRDLRGVFIAASWALIFLVLVARFWPNLPQRMAFFTGNLFNLIIAFAVIAQVVIYRKQWRVMEQQWKETQRGIESAEKNSIWANRAYVVAKIRDTGPKDPDRLMLRLRIQNNGNTPANDVIVRYAYGLRDKPPHEETLDGIIVYDIGYAETERLGLIASQSSYHVISTPTVKFPFAFGDKAKFEQWKTGELRFYCWGRIAYEDIFSEKRHTDFCFMLSDQHENGYPCKHGNEAF